MIRSVLGGPLCCVCHTTVPTKRVEYDNGRLETYCEEHFPIYERTKDVDIQDITKTWNCQIAPSEGYSLRPKSSLADRTIICNRCRVTRIFFDDTQRGYNNVLIPLEYRTFKPHNCDISYPFFCEWCNTKLYHDKKIRTDSGKLIPIQFEDEVCFINALRTKEERSDAYSI